MKRFTLKELIVAAMLAAMGIAVKPLLSPVFNVLTDFIRIPGGSATAGISVMFLVAAAALIRKRGTALLAGLLQGLLSLATGISAAAGVLVLITYSLPGLAIDLVMLLPVSLPDRTRRMLAGSAGVLAGAAATNLLYFRMSVIPFILFYAVGILSGALGGWIVHLILQRLPESVRKGIGAEETGSAEKEREENLEEE